MINMDMNQNIKDARMRVQDNLTNNLNPAMRRAMEINPFMQYGSQSMETQAPTFSPLATTTAAGIYGTNIDKQLSLMNPGINTSAVI
tara:strand:- start:1147 stop:1407 length:261 start_codon:yes stop_codon:yes gene_type:complete